MNDKDNVLEFEGEVIHTTKGLFTVKVNEKFQILCTLSGKIRMSNIRILVGDMVRVESSVYSPGRGRIVYRNKGLV